MRQEVLLAAVTTLAISTVLTFVVRKFALLHGILDLPSERSSHSVPTPRGGGLAIVIAASMTLVAMAALGHIQLDSLFAVLVGGLAVAGIGFADDRLCVKPWARLAVHLAAAAWAVTWLGGLPPLQLGERLVDLGLAGYLLGVMGITWVLNLFNFMDGIDGIAASEAGFICLGGAVLGVAYAGPSETTLMAVIVVAASVGFLVWNWPPASIFMGDVGSGYLGFVISVLALTAARENPVMLFAWLILGAVFLLDATITLIRRLARGERVYEAHRSHAYQWLARRWGSHLRVTVTVLVINAVWLLPLAWLSVARPELAAWATAAAMLPLGALALISGAGRSEHSKAGAECAGER